MPPYVESSDVSPPLIQDNFQKKKIKESEDATISGGTKGSIPMKLGSLKTLCIFVVHYIISTSHYYYAKDKEPNIPMSRKPLIQNHYVVTLLMGAYVSFCLVWGPKIMKNRNPIKPKKLMMIYNLIQVLACSYLFIKSSLHLWFPFFGLMEINPESMADSPDSYCYPEDRSDTPFNQVTADFVYMYFLLKGLDWCDTIFLVLQKKWAHISLLHIIHHYGMFYGTWAFAKHVGSGHHTFVGYINLFVHIVLYTYYFLALLGPKVQKHLWWKKYLTMLQILQFAWDNVHVILGMVHGCDLRIESSIIVLIYSTAFMFLFADFYRLEYVKAKKDNAINANTKGQINNNTWKKED